MTINLKLYESDGLTLRYTFPYVQAINAPKTIEKFTEIEGIRGNGSIIITGSEKSWDLQVQGVLKAADYEALTVLIDALETAVAFADPYYIKIDKVEGGASTYSYKVKRIIGITYPETLRNGLGVQKYTVTFRVGEW